jgi:hypothetical protein
VCATPLLWCESTTISQHPATSTAAAPPVAVATTSDRDYRRNSDIPPLPLRHQWPLQPCHDTASESHPAAVNSTFFSKLDSCRKTLWKSRIFCIYKAIITASFLFGSRKPENRVVNCFLIAVTAFIGLAMNKVFLAVYPVLIKRFPMMKMSYHPSARQDELQRNKHILAYEPDVIQIKNRNP